MADVLDVSKVVKLNCSIYNALGKSDMTQNLATTLRLTEIRSTILFSGGPRGYCGGNCRRVST
jgi:hypothetical protein